MAGEDSFDSPEEGTLEGDFSTAPETGKEEFRFNSVVAGERGFGAVSDAGDWTSSSFGANDT